MRNNYVGIRVNEIEKEELARRAKEQHLKLSSYCRWFLFSRQFFEGTNEIRIERISRGIPKRLASQQATDAVKHTLRQKEVMAEMKQVFKEGLKLEHVSNEMKKQVLKNRELEPFNPHLTLENLNPPE
ncbi:MAG: hypothetical protein OEL89_00795 [Candidatus Peregrinibacteria bacterium]|nr:hypothetical protein [Candidatus Peregrinibacteria bacterium]